MNPKIYENLTEELKTFCIPHVQKYLRKMIKEETLKEMKGSETVVDFFTEIEHSYKATIASIFDSARVDSLIEGLEGFCGYVAPQKEED